MLVTGRCCFFGIYKYFHLVSLFPTSCDQYMDFHIHIRYFSQFEQCLFSVRNATDSSRGPQHLPGTNRVSQHVFLLDFLLKTLLLVLLQVTKQDWMEKEMERRPVLRLCWMIVVLVKTSWKCLILINPAWVAGLVSLVMKRIPL